MDNRVNLTWLTNSDYAKTARKWPPGISAPELEETINFMCYMNIYGGTTARGYDGKNDARIYLWLTAMKKELATGSYTAARGRWLTNMINSLDEIDLTDYSK